MTQASKQKKGTAAEPVVRIDSEVTRRVRQHARLHPKTEVCGVLVGDNQSGVIEVRASIEGINAAQAGTHVTFTQDAWEAIYRVKDELYPDERIVGWYHSHPGFGVFLSEHDMFIQENFFSSPGQVAWVYDPHTDEEGCFGWVAGEVHRIQSLSIADRNGDGTERTPKHVEFLLPDQEEELEPMQLAKPKRNAPLPRWAQLTATALSHLAVLAVGFAACYFFLPRLIALVPDPETGKVLALEPNLFTGKVTIEDGSDLSSELGLKLQPSPAPGQDPALPALDLHATHPPPSPDASKPAPPAGGKPPSQSATPTQSAKPGPSGAHP